MSQDDENEQEETPGAEMSFLDHLGELRTRLIKAVLAVLLMMAVSFAFSNDIIRFLLKPPVLLPGLKAPMDLMRPVITQVQGLMVVKLQIGLIAGIVFSLPVILYQIWRFVSPGLRKQERRLAIPIIFTSTLFFLVGAAFAFVIVVPITLNFLLTMGEIDKELGIIIENMIDLDQYLGFVSGFMLITGITFQLPVLAFFLTRIGLLTSRFMRKYWRHAAISALAVSAVVTPTTDMITLFVVAVPIVLLYEVGIWVSFVTERRKKRS